MSESWEEFRNRCAAAVQKIQDTKDDGVYAKLYATDVARLLLLVREMDHVRDLDVATDADYVWGQLDP